MSNTDLHVTPRRPTIHGIAVALGFAALIGAFASAPAFADDHHDRDHRPPPRHYAHRGPAVVYDQPPVVYAPSEVVEAPQPSVGVNLFLPLNIR